jgi:hypothetical protein
MDRELRAYGFLGMSPGPDLRKVKNLDPGLHPVFFSSISSTLCVHEHIGTTVVTTYNWLLGEKNRYKIISCFSFLTINASKMKNFRSVEKRRSEVVYVDFSSTVFRFQVKCKPGFSIHGGAV